MKKIFDVMLGFLLLLLLAIPMLLIGVVVRFTSRGSSLYWSDRVGKNNKIIK
jgi:O-antigen biosynthesis protein WbqP